MAGFFSSLHHSGIGEEGQRSTQREHCYSGQYSGHGFCPNYVDIHEGGKLLAAEGLQGHPP